MSTKPAGSEGGAVAGPEDGAGVAALARLGIVAVMLGDGKIGWRGTRGSGEWLFESRRAIPADGDALLPVGVHALPDGCSGLPLTESLDDGWLWTCHGLLTADTDGCSAQKSVKPKKKAAKRVRTNPWAKMRVPIAMPSVVGSDGLPIQI